MADEQKNLANEVSEFLCESYQQIPGRKHCLLTYFQDVSYQAKHPVDGIECRTLPVVTGSTVSSISTQC